MYIHFFTVIRGHHDLWPLKSHTFIFESKWQLVKVDLRFEQNVTNLQHNTKYLTEIFEKSIEKLDKVTRYEL